MLTLSFYGIIRTNPTIQDDYEMSRKPSEDKIKKIHEAADAIVADGNEAPTNDEVREKAGGGSISDISFAMRMWRDNRKKEDQDAIEMPPELKSVGLRLVTQIWSHLNEDANKRIEEAEKKATTRTLDLEEELKQCLTSMSELEERLNKTAAELDSQKIKLSQTESDCRNLEKQAHKHELDKEKALTKLENAQENEKSLKEQLSMLQKELLTVARSAATKKASKS